MTTVCLLCFIRRPYNINIAVSLGVFFLNTLMFCSCQLRETEREIWESKVADLRKLTDFSCTLHNSETQKRHAYRELECSRFSRSTCFWLKITRQKMRCPIEKRYEVLRNPGGSIRKLCGSPRLPQKHVRILRGISGLSVYTLSVLIANERYRLRQIGNEIPDKRESNHSRSLCFPSFGGKHTNFCHTYCRTNLICLRALLRKKGL